MMRAMLYEAMLGRSSRWSWLKAWATQIAKRRGMKRAIVALARRLAALQGNSNGMVILVRANLSGLTWELVLRAIMVVRTHLIFLSGRPWWAIGASRS